MENNSDKQSLISLIQNVAKLLRTEVKKKGSPFTASHNSKKSSSSDFVNNIEQIAKLLRLQAHRSLKKKRSWRELKP